MKKKSRKSIFITGLFLLFFLAVSITVQAEAENSQKAKLTSRIAVISFQALTPAEGNSVFCPLCGNVTSSGKVLEGSEKIVEEIFLERLSKIEGVELIPSDKVQSVYKRISSEQLKSIVLENLKKVGQELGADYVVTGYVYRYTERVGYKYSSEHPASVIFEIHLVRSSDGSIIWRGFFDKTQKSLMENILDISSFFKGGAKWITVRQLTEQGMDEIFKSFPNLQR